MKLLGLQTSGHHLNGRQRLAYGSLSYISTFRLAKSSRTAAKFAKKGLSWE